MQKIFETEEISWVKVRKIVGLTVQMNKSGRQTYLNEYEESFIFVSAEIEGGHSLPLDFRGAAHQLQNDVKSIKSWCGNDNIQEQSPLGYFG